MDSMAADRNGKQFLIRNSPPPRRYQWEFRYNEEGEVCFSGEAVMLGYYHNQQATDDIIKTHSDGREWLHTGDIGYINEDGVVFITWRIKRIIMTKGADKQVILKSKETPRN